MKIEQIFEKQLTRAINGVVKAEQMNDEAVFVELDEYVVTNELDKHFRAFFEAYGPATHASASALSDKIGVWISGFFGSGKSHFLKILSYLLENKMVEKDGQGRAAFEFFQNKINDPMLLADIQQAVTRPTDVILFNIDSRASTDDAENAVLKVFLKVFNERVGYCADFAHIAHLERELDKRGQYQAFKAKFAELVGSSWEQENDSYDFYRDEMAEALSHASGQSIESARAWVEQLEKNFPLDIKNFCEWVNDYLETNGDRNLLFLVDEVGQFIGKNTQMMLKLQTITENLGTICRGRAWVVVTSQADIDAAIGGMAKSDGDDFSKIQGRFDTRLALSSSNTSEVIQRRLLAKTEPAHHALVELYAEKGDILRNQLMFDQTTTAELKGYTDAPSFADNYPFVPYHYKLVQKVFESIRTKGATGKHLAMGERSLLDAFQSAAKQIKDETLDVLVPFYSFYEPIEGFLEPAVKRTIDQACENEALTDFDAKILKTLFLIRYVDTVKSTLDNLVTLTVDKIDTDKISLRKQIEDSLNRLDRQLLIARNGDEYVFLTNEEKEIENEIRHTEYEASEVSGRLATFIFDDVLKGKRQYRFPDNKQDFAMSRFCNGHPKDGANQEELVLKVISPLDSQYALFERDQSCLDHTTEGGGCILVKLGDEQKLFADLTTYIQTERFLRQNASSRPEQAHILREKQLENQNREKRLREGFEALFCQAEVFSIGTKMKKTSPKPDAMVEAACHYLIENSFAKLSMLKPTPGEVLREINSVLNADDLAQQGLDLGDSECNPEATREIDQYVSLRHDRSEAIYLKDLTQHFGKRPYGWPANEVLLILARLGLAGKISFVTEGRDLPLKQAYDYFTSVRRHSDVRVKKVQQHNEQKLKRAATLAKALFSGNFVGLSEKDLHSAIANKLTNWQTQLKDFQSKAQTGNFPGKADIEQGIALLAGVLSHTASYQFIEQFVADSDALEDFEETFEDLEDFYDSQFQTWLNLQSALTGTFSANRTALDKEPKAEAALKQLESIWNNPNPYNQLRNIAGLIKEVENINQDLVQQKRDHGLQRVQQRIDRVQQELTEAQAPAELSNKALRPLQQCKQRIENTMSIPQIMAQQSEAENAEEEAFDYINRYVDDLNKAAEPAPEPQANADESKPTGNLAEPPVMPVAPPKVKRTITITASLETSKPYLETEQDVEQYLVALEQKLRAVVKNGDKVRLK